MPSCTAPLPMMRPGYAMSSVPLEQMMASLRPASSSNLGAMKPSLVVMRRSLLGRRVAYTQPLGLGSPAT